MSQETRSDTGRFTILKNIKAYRDANSISGEDDSAFADSGYTSSHFSSYSQEHVSGKHVSSLTLEPIEEEQQTSIDNDIMATPSAPAPIAGTSTVITPNTANMQKIMDLHITTPTEIKSPEKPEFLEPKTPQKSINDSRALNTTPRKAKLSRKRSFVEENTENNAENKVKRTRTTKSKDDDEILALRMPFSPISKPNQRILRERSVSDNNLLHRSSTPKSVLRRRIFAVGNTDTTPEKRTLRRFQSFSPNAGLKRKTLSHPYKRSMAFDRPGSSKDSPNDQILKNIPETEEEPEDLRDVRAGSVSFSIDDASGFIETSFNMSPIVKSDFNKLFAAPILPPNIASATAAFQLPEKTETSSMLMLKSQMEVSPSKVDPNLSLFHDLPRTPPKEAPTKLKRTRATPLKRNLLHKRTDFFDGLEQMDILSRLQVAPRLIDQIFQHLSDDDVLSACMVSYRWKMIIEESKVLNQRRVAYVQAKRPNKENAREKVVVVVTNTRTMRPRQPFAVHNYDTRSSTKLENSPPASPGKVKFRENQKIIRKLSPRAMTTCIRCGKPSPIITQKARDQVIKIGRSTRSSAKKSVYNLRKTVSDTSAMLRPFDDSMMFHFDTSGSDSSGSEKKIRRALFNDTKARASVGTASPHSSSSSLSPCMSVDISPAEYEEYGSCSGKQCGFKFCVKCLTEYHPGEPCRSTLEVFSPGRLEELATSRGNLMCSRQSRRTLKRLCS